MADFLSEIKKPVFWVETDGEPDDIMALLFLSGTGAFAQIVVGESTTPLAIAIRISSFLRVDQGMTLNTMIGLPSKNTGVFSCVELLHGWMVTTPYSRAAYIAAFKAFVSVALGAGGTPVFIGLKPPRELVECAGELEGAMGKTLALSYGGFNYRSVVQDKQCRPGELEALLTKFKMHATYESFHATGARNSVNAESHPELFALIQNKQFALAAKLDALLLNWNSHLLENCINACRRMLVDPDKLESVAAMLETIEGDEERIAAVVPFLSNPGDARRFVLHNLKPMQSIAHNKSGQFLLADQCAVLAFFDAEIRQRNLVKARVSFNADGYTNVAPEAASAATYVFKDIPRDRMLKLLLDNLNASLPVQK